MLHGVRKNLEEHGDKLPADDKASIERDMEALKQALDGDDADAIREKAAALTQSSMKLGEAVYAAGQAGNGAADPGQASDSADAANDGEKVVDADFEDLDKNNKDKS